ncbi:Type I restriction enzyme, modification chain [Candidatus Methylobacter favarea]|uniref:site-specific DNA-methyltransferase (adenine-specific) n=1 Tax=Candidatus Methylobacter favarea TaxID=2707345 RepID=A0A8S0WKI2_9GAMM|nr:type I restriction-modification system subunit M [Candidatus Methylobacter favarea]CAA9892000.1 Type I restriction enzyme, modification chain [Candidatus Methylobacter favarea]
MAIKKSELYSSLWSSCDQLRGSMDASQYKDYILVLLFVKYVSDKYSGVKDGPIEVPEGGSFKDMAALKGQKDIGEKIDIIIAKLAAVNNLNGVITVACFNDENKLGKGKEMQDRLSNLVAIFENESLNFSKNRADGDDILGDAYEYLMRHFASVSGKDKGQFYTPAEVSRVVAKIVGVTHDTKPEKSVYDPTCGSGSLLLKVADEADRGLSIYGQEKDNATTGLCKMNMILHSNEDAEIAPNGDTLTSPYFKDKQRSLKTFDFAVANPPFSTKSWSHGINPADDDYSRFSFGIPPEKNGDYAFLLHIIRSLKPNGKGAVILPHGVLFRGNAEARIRENLINKGYIKGIIGLPANLFYGTGIPACIIVIDKENAVARKGIFMIDAGKDFIKDGDKNRLREQDIHKIVDVFNKQIETPRYARMVSLDEIAGNGYNLNIPRYINSQEPEDQQDIEAHLLGGIPDSDIDALNDYWAVCPTLRADLFTASNRPGYSQLNTAENEIKTTIYQHPEFAAYSRQIQNTFSEWRTRQTIFLKALQAQCKPKNIIHPLSEDLLAAFANTPLIDQYDVYQSLMTYWLESMKDDIYLISEGGWKAELTHVLNKSGKVSEIICELIPKPLMINRYFKKEQAAIDAQEISKEKIVRQMEELQEEHGGEDGLFAEAITDSGKLSKASITERLKNPITELDAEEITQLNAYLKLLEQETKVNKQIREATAALDNLVLTRYPTLSEDEIKTLVVDDKWMTTIAEAVHAEMDRLSQRLTGRITQLAERFAMPLPAYINEVETLAASVDEHLKKMGIVWN